MIKASLGKIRRTLGALRRECLRLWDSGLHSRRRTRAFARIRAWPIPTRVLFLCLGNVCRSPYAEAYLKKEGADLGIDAESAGFIGPGRSPPEEALQAASNRNVDTGRHISRTITREMVLAHDLIILVDAGHGVRLRREVGSVARRVLVLGDLDPEPVVSRTIIDPWGEDPETFNAAFDRIDRCLHVLLTEWRRIDNR